MIDHATAQLMLRLRCLEDAKLAAGSTSDHLFWELGDRFGIVSKVVVTEYVASLGRHILVPEDPVRREEFDRWKTCRQGF